MVLVSFTFSAAVVTTMAKISGDTVGGTVGHRCSVLIISLDDWCHFRNIGVGGTIAVAIGTGMTGTGVGVPFVKHFLENGA